MKKNIKFLQNLYLRPVREWFLPVVFHIYIIKEATPSDAVEAHWGWGKDEGWNHNYEPKVT